LRDADAQRAAFFDFGESVGGGARGDRILRGESFGLHFLLRRGGVRRLRADHSGLRAFLGIGAGFFHRAGRVGVVRPSRRGIVSSGLGGILTESRQREDAEQQRHGDGHDLRAEKMFEFGHGPVPFRRGAHRYLFRRLL
jgi:hypothetical protein